MQVRSMHTSPISHLAAKQELSNSSLQDEKKMHISMPIRTMMLELLLFKYTKKAPFQIFRNGAFMLVVIFLLLNARKSYISYCVTC